MFVFTSMNRTLFLVVFLCTASLATAQQNSAAQVMDRFSAAMQEVVAAEMHFVFSGADGRGIEITPFEGVIYRQGADFAMLNSFAEVYACGNTKWIFTVDNNEAVVMTHDPTSVDLAENPLALFSAQHSKEYALSGKPNRFTDNGKEITEITLTPKGKNMPYTSILLRIYSQTFTPHSVKYNAKDGGWYEAVIINYTPKKQPFPPERFIFSAAEHPGVYVADLR